MNVKKILKVVTKNMDDETYLKLVFRIVMKQKLHLDDPKTLNEKIQWLKLHNRDEMLSTYVDKYKVKKVVSDIIGDEYIIPTLGVWEDFDDIDFSTLPNQFVLKCNHDSHSVVICKDKDKFNYKEAKEKLNKSLKNNYFWHGREWAYKNVKPLILAEQYMTDDDQAEELTDYKFYCFKEYVDSVMVCCERETGNPQFYFFDTKWNFKRDYNKNKQEAPLELINNKPFNFEKMCDLASKLSSATGAPFVRVDFYNINGKPYFGELTFTPRNGLKYDISPEIDLKFGNMTDISNIWKP